MALVDKRIVEMVFKNKDFEKNAQQSMNTIDKLKQATQFEQNTASLDKIAESVQKLQERFSGLGIVGKRVLENITDSVMHLSGKMTSFLSSSVISGGISRAMNLENSRFMMQNLFKDEQKVTDAMANVSASVDGTAYSLDQAALVATQFTAAGVEIGDELEKSLKGLAGTAATFNTDYARLGNVFSDVASSGRVMGDTLLQLATRGIPAQQVLADFFNQVLSGDEAVKDVPEEVQTMVKSAVDGFDKIQDKSHVTAGEIKELASTGAINFQMFSEAMYTTFGENASKANETFTGALSNIKSALARIGAGFVEPLVIQNGPLVSMFNAIREKTNEVKKGLVFDKEVGNTEALSKRVTDFVIKRVDQLTEKIKTLDISKILTAFYNGIDGVVNLLKLAGDILRPVREAFRAVFPKKTIDDVVTLSEKFKSFTASLQVSEKTLLKLKDIFKGFFAALDVGKTIMISLAKTVGPILLNVLGAIFHYILTVTSALGRALSGFRDFINALHSALKSPTDEIVGLPDRIASSFENSPAFNAILTILKKFRDGFQSIMNSFKKIKTDDATRPIKKIEEEVTVLDSLLAGVKAFGEGLLKVFNTIKNIITPIVKWVGDAIEGVFTKAMAILGAIDTDHTMNLIFDGGMAAIFTSLASAIKNFGRSFRGGGGLGSSLAGFLSKVGDAIHSFKAYINAATLKLIADAILELVAAIFILALIPEKEAIRGLMIIMGIIGALELVMKSVQALSDGLVESATIALIGVAMMALAAAILTIVAAIFILAFVGYDTVTKGLMTISAICFILVKTINSIVNSLESSKWKAITGTAGIILSLTAAISAIVLNIVALALLSRFVGYEYVVAAVSAIGMIVLVLVYSIDALLESVEEANISDIVKMIFTVVTLTAAITLIATTVSVLAIILGLIPSTIIERGLIVLSAVLLAVMLLGVMIQTSFEDQEITKTLKAIANYVLLAAAIGLIATVYAGISTLLGLIPTTWLLAGLVGIGLIIAAMGLFYYVLIKTADKIDTGKLLVTITKLMLLTTVTTALFGALLIMAAAIGGVMTVLGTVNVIEISSFIVALLSVILVGALLSAKVPRFSKGLKAMSDAILELSKAFIIFAIGARFLEQALVDMKDLTDKDIKHIGENFKGLIRVLAEAAPDIVAAIFVIASSVVSELLQFVVDNVPLIIQQAVTALVESLWVIAETAPQIIEAVFAVLYEVIEALRPIVGKIIDEIILLVIDIINGVANAIKKNQDAILDAIDNLLDSIISLVIQAFGRLFGKNKRDVAKWIEAHKKTLRTFVKWFGITLAGLKIIGIMKKLGSILSVVKTIGSKMAAIKIGAGGMSSVQKLGSEIAEGPLAKIKQFNSYFGGHGILVASISAAAIAGALALKHMVDEMEVVTEDVHIFEQAADAYKQAFDNAYSKASRAGDDFVQTLRDQGRAMDDEAYYVDNLLGLFDQYVDSNGKVKASGKELVESGLKKINEEFGTNYSIVDDVISKNGEAISSYQNLRSEIEKTAQLTKGQSYLDEFKDEYEEALNFINDPENVTKLADFASGKTKQALETEKSELEDAIRDLTYDSYSGLFRNWVMADKVPDFNADQKAFMNALEKAGYNVDSFKQGLQDIRDYFHSSKWEWETHKSLNEMLEEYVSWEAGVSSNEGTNLGKLTKRLNEVGTELGNLDGEYLGLSKAMEQYTTTITNYEKLDKAVSSGQTDRIEEYTRQLKHNLGTRETMTEESLAKQFETQRKYAEAELELLKNKQKGIRALDVYDAIQSEYDAWKALPESLQKVSGRSSLMYEQLLKGLSSYVSKTQDLITESVPEKDTIGDKAKEAADAVTNPFSGGGDIMKDYGSETEAGWEIGNDPEKYGENASSAWNKWETTLHKDGGFGSPSKKMIQYGKWAVQGFAIGLSDVTDVNRAAYNMVNTLLGSVGVALAAADSMPTITPLVDLSNVQNGTATMQAMLNGNALQAQNLNAKLSTELAAAINGDIHAATEAVVDSIDQLRLDVNSLRRDIRDINVVLNTGALVGQLAGPMDAALGGLSVLKRSGV